MPRVLVLSPVKAHGRWRRPGDEVGMDERTAADVVAAGAGEILPDAELVPRGDFAALQPVDPIIGEVLGPAAGNTDTPDATLSAGATDGAPGGAAGQAPNPAAAEEADRTEPPPPASDTSVDAPQPNAGDAPSPADAAPPAPPRKGKK
jgi:hypothetical protein